LRLSSASLAERCGLLVLCLVDIFMKIFEMKKCIGVMSDE